MTGVDGVTEAGSSRGPCNVQTTNHRCDDEERGDEAEEEHDEAMVALPMTRRTLATLQPRLNLASTASLRLTARCTSDMGCLRAPPLRGRRLSKHTRLPTISLRGRAHNAHGRAMPVAVNSNAGALIPLKRHPCLVPVRIFAHRNGRLRNTPRLCGNIAARNSFLLRYRDSVLRGTRICRRTRHGGGLAPNHRNLGGDDLFGGRGLGRAGHRGQARLLAQTRGDSIGRIVLRHLPRTDSIRVRRPGPHNSSISN